MAIPSITPFPTPAPARTQAPEVFRPAADATIAHIPTFVAQANAFAAAANVLEANIESRDATTAANAAAAQAGATQSLAAAAIATQTALYPFGDLALRFYLMSLPRSYITFAAANKNLELPAATGFFEDESPIIVVNLAIGNEAINLEI